MIQLSDEERAALRQLQAAIASDQVSWDRRMLNDVDEGRTQEHLDLREMILSLPLGD